MALDAATLAKVHQVLTLLGANTDGAGTGSVFARLVQIAGYTDQVEGFVDTLETLLGTNTDSAGTGTVFARLSQIAGYTDTVESLVTTVDGVVDAIKLKTDLVGATGDSSATATLFGRLQRIYEAVDTEVAAIKAKTDLIGATGDVAGTATLFAWMKRLEAYVDEIENKIGRNIRIVPSANVKFSRPSEVAHIDIGSGSSRYAYSGKFDLPGPGQFKLSAEMRKSGSYSTARVVVGVVDKSTEPSLYDASSQFDPSTLPPEGTNISFLPTTGFKSATLSGSDTSYTLKEMTISVKEASTVFVYIGGGNTSQGSGSFYVRNVTVGYDES